MLLLSDASGCHWTTLALGTGTGQHWITPALDTGHHYWELDNRQVPAMCLLLQPGTQSESLSIGRY